jgi:hypothetical protein
MNTDKKGQEFRFVFFIRVHRRSSAAINLWFSRKLADAEKL